MSKDKKQRQKSKRDAKKRELRRRDGISPLKRLADAPGELECWMTGDLDVQGQIQISIWKRAAGLSAVAAFLIDRGVVGLKDAWARMKVDRAEFQNMLDGGNSSGIVMQKVSVEKVRSLIAGGVRWAHENGMRLPKDWTKTAALIGGVGDWASADVSKFIKEFAGHPSDLRKRLIGEPFETFIRRKDIQILLSDAAPHDGPSFGYDEISQMMVEGEDDEPDDDGDFIDSLPEEHVDAMLSRFTPAAMGLAVETATFLSARAEQPSNELTEAWRTFMLASMISKAGMPNASESESADFGWELIKELSGRIEDHRMVEYEKAVGQALDHFGTDALLIQKAVIKYGLEDDKSEVISPSDAGKG